MSSPSRGPGCGACSPTSTTRDSRTTSFAYKLNLPPEYLLIHRVWSGGIGVLSQLGGTVRGRETVDAFLPGANLPPVGDLISQTRADDSDHD